MRRVALAASFALVVAPGIAMAQPEDEEEEEEEGGDEEEEEEEEEEEPDETITVDEGKPKPKAKAPKKDDFKKQDLRGHAVDAEKIGNPFQKDRFFVDKVDSEKTEKGTLVQGSLQVSTFAYTESSDALPGMAQGTAASKFSRYFGDARLQMDFRHISAGKWDARLDARVRGVNTGAPAPGALTETETNRVQSGFNGSNELELRELWLVRSGQRSDLFLGRQFVTDLGALKFDGLRIDYAQSEKITLITFGGLFPLRGSRSLTTDYPKLQTVPTAAEPNGQPAGRFVGTAGAGAAYRTDTLHGAFGGVAQIPFSGEGPRVYATANGYFRGGSKLDFYHYGVVDLVGPNNFALTNLSVGANLKPDPRLRITASFNRVDTETLGVQAGAFLNDRDGNAPTKVQNETFIKQVATNAARASLSAGLGSLQRFELTIAGAFRFRPEITLQTPGGAPADAVKLAAAKGVDISGGVVDRRSILGLRLGFDLIRSIGIGQVAFQRSEVFAGRVFGLRELANGRGELEVEVAYATTLDKAAGTDCQAMGGFSGPDRCFGTSQGAILSVGGSAYYRIKQNWFGLGNIYVSRQTLQRRPMDMVLTDPPVLGITGFLRAAYRF